MYALNTLIIFRLCSQMLKYRLHSRLAGYAATFNNLIRTGCRMPQRHLTVNGPDPDIAHSQSAFRECDFYYPGSSFSSVRTEVGHDYVNTTLGMSPHTLVRFELKEQPGSAGKNY